MTSIPTDHDYLAYSFNSTFPSGNGYALIIISPGNMTLSKMYFAVEDGQEIAFLPNSLQLLQADGAVVVRAMGSHPQALRK